jgi:hypothetical protein
MSESAIRDYALAKGFQQQTLERWLSWTPADRDVLAEIAIGLKTSENHLREMMDWLEEISLRDRTKICDVMARQEIFAIRTNPRLGRADKVKRVKEQLRRWRFPRLAAIEDTIRQNIQALKLPPEIRLSVPAGLEGGRLEAQISAGSLAEFQRLTSKLNEAAAQSFIAEIFQCLSPISTEKEPEQN